MGLIVGHQPRLSALNLDIDHRFLHTLHFTAKYVELLLQVRVLRVIGRAGKSRDLQARVINLVWQLGLRHCPLGAANARSRLE